MFQEIKFMFRVNTHVISNAIHVFNAITKVVEFKSKMVKFVEKPKLM